MKLLHQELAVLSNLIVNAAHQTLLDAGKLGEDTARNTTLFKNNGALRDATNFHPVSQFSGFVLADKSYAQYLEYGNPYAGFIIEPKVAKVLHFWIDGKEIFAKKVKAHGPLKFMEAAEKKVEEQIEHIWNNNFDRFVK